MACIQVATILSRASPALPLHIAIQELIVGCLHMGSRNREERKLKMMPNHSLPAQAAGQGSGPGQLGDFG